MFVTWFFAVLAGVATQIAVSGAMRGTHPVATGIAAGAAVFFALAVVIVAVRAKRP